MALSLAEMTVWVTRPTPQATALADALQKYGANTIIQPAMAIKPCPEASEAWRGAKSLIMDLDNFQHIIFISTNAVCHGMAIIETYWPQLPQQQIWYAIGQSTADALASFGVKAQLPAQGSNSEALLQLPGLHQVTDAKILIVSGLGGRQFLRQQLQDRGARVSVAECYQRSLPDNLAADLAQQLSQSGIDVITAGSVETLQNLLVISANQADAIIQTTVVVPGQRVADAAAKLGFHEIITANSASNEDTATALSHWWQQRRPNQGE
ncbi:MAG: uroporphyrinogen-III synthase [Pseudomonadales bacterium]